VIGVGGGGGNAVQHMYREGIHDVTFVLCNTDSQALMKSDIPVKLQLGKTITKGLGAGNKPGVAKEAAEESAEAIKELLNDGTEMVFVTAGMGGGTGTGAAPVIAGIAKEMGILTIGIITIPFVFEGRHKILQAIEGAIEMSKSVDSIIVVHNERLIDIYKKLTVREGFAKADDTLTVAAKSIAETITLPGEINLDFADVKTTLKDGGVAIMSIGMASGSNRIANAFENALHSPLINNNNAFDAKKILFNISSSESAPLIMEEMTEINNFMAKFESKDIEVIWGTAVDEKLEENVKITIIATGFGIESIPDENAKLIKEEEKTFLIEEENR
jgi:cell division protein FtsZ